MIQKNQWQKAKALGEEGYQKALSFKMPDLILKFALNLVRTYQELGQADEALKMYEVAFGIQDSIYNEENARALINQEYQYTYQQKAYQDSLRNDSKLQIQAADIERRKLANWFFIGLIALISFFCHNFG